jgi:FkbM family methyltransferase
MQRRGRTRGIVGRLLAWTGLELLPVRIKGGIAAGARWTLFPWTGYWRGRHEPDVQQAILGLGDLRGKSCWDLGAHFGYYSVGLAGLVGPSGSVAAFEPDAASFGRLERHRRMNGLEWLAAFNAAVSDVDGIAALITDGETGSVAAHLAYDGEVPPESSAMKPVQAVRLDTLVAGGRIRPPDFVKVDVEGHAHRALEGCRATLADRRPIMIVAFHSESEVEGVIGLLKPLGYGWNRIGGDAAISDETPGAAMVGHDYLFTPGQEGAPR